MSQSKQKSNTRDECTISGREIRLPRSPIGEGVPNFEPMRSGLTFTKLFTYMYCIEQGPLTATAHTDKKGNKIFLIHKEIKRDRVRSGMGKNLRLSSYIRKPFLIYDFAPDPI